MNEADWLQGLAPIVDEDSEHLILGSMPGAESLRLGRYYAHPRNGFWPILGSVYGFVADAPYPHLVEALRRHRIAVWDVVGRCRREGSLDSAIATEDLEINDLPGLLRAHPRIRHVYFNGSFAEKTYRNRIGFEATEDPPTFHRLPSTSPAYASVPLESKRRVWASALLAHRLEPVAP